MCEYFKKAMHYIFNLVKTANHRVRLWLALLIILLCFGIPFPNIFINGEYMPEIVPGPNDSKEGTAKIDMTGQLFSASLLERLMGLAGQNFNPPTISICLNNDIHPYPPNINLGTSTAVLEKDGVGGMSLTAVDADTHIAYELYAPYQTSRCKIFTNGHVTIQANDLQFKSMLMPVTLLGQTVYLRYTNFGNTKISVKIVVNWWTYFFEVLILLLVISVLAQGIDTLLKLILRK